MVPKLENVLIDNMYIVELYMSSKIKVPNYILLVN